MMWRIQVKRVCIGRVAMQALYQNPWGGVFNIAEREEKMKKTMMKLGLTLCAVIVGFVLSQSAYGKSMQWYPAENWSKKDPSLVRSKFHLRGKLRQSTFPKEALVGQIFVNLAHNREYIYDGVQWVPHDAGVDQYYRDLRTSKLVTPGAPAAPGQPACPGQPSTQGQQPAGNQLLAPSGLLAPDQISIMSMTGPACTPTGAHGNPQDPQNVKHSLYPCSTCHTLGGSMCFDPAGPAFAQNRPAPAFDFTAKTCSNIACHGMYEGTFSYFFPGGDGEPELKTVTYGGNGGGTPSWYSTAGGCSACHGNPPPAYPAWHGMHANGNSNCQLCHPNATGTGGVGTAITNPALHANQVVNVQPQWRSACFNCH